MSESSQLVVDMDRINRGSLPVVTPPADDIESLSRDDILREEGNLIEVWLERTMQEIYKNANSLGLGLKQGKDGALESSGLDRSTLLRKGFQPDQIDILYRTMYAHSAGYYYTLHGGYGFEVDAENSDQISVVLKLLSSHIQKRGAKPLVQEDEQPTAEQEVVAFQKYEPKTSRVIDSANAELASYSQLKVQRSQMQRKLELSREKRRKLEVDVDTLVALSAKRDQELIQRHEDSEKMRKEINELNDAHTRLLYELQNSKNTLQEEKRKIAKYKSESSESGASSRESHVERRGLDETSKYRSPSVSHSVTNGRDLVERLATAEKQNAEHREEIKVLSRRSKTLSDLYQQEATNCAALKLQMEEMLNHGASSSTLPIPGKRKTLAAPSIRMAERLQEVAERRLSQATVDGEKLKMEVARLTNRDAEDQELQEKYKGMNTLMDLKDSENAELRKELDARDYQHKLLAEQCEALAEKYETLRLLPDVKDADIGRLQEKIEEQNARLANLSVAEEHFTSLEEQCEENKRLISSKDVEIRRLMNAQAESKVEVAKPNLQEDQLNSLQKQHEEIKILISIKDAEIEQLKQAQQSREAQLKALQGQLDAATRLGDYKDAEIGKLNKDLDESVFRSLTLNEKVIELDAEAQGNEQTLRDLQAEIEVLKSAITDSKLREGNLKFSLQELEAAKAEEADQSRKTTNAPDPMPAEIQAELSQTQERYALLQTNYVKLEAEHNFLKAQKGEVLKLHSMLAAAQSQLRTKSDDSSRLLGELNSLRRELERFRAAKNSENKDVSRALHRLAEREAEQTKAREELAKAHREITRLQQELSNCGVELVLAQTELSNMRNQLSSKESELLDVQLSTSDARMEEMNKLKELMKKRTAAMKKFIMEVNSIHAVLQPIALDTARSVEFEEFKVLKLPMEITGHDNRNSSSAGISEGTASHQDFEILNLYGESMMKEAAYRGLVTGTEPKDRDGTVGFVYDLNRMPTLQDMKVDEAFEILNELDREAEATTKSVKETAWKATQALRSEINLQSIQIQELLQEKSSWKEKIVSYSFSLSALTDLMWTIWNKALLAAKTFYEVSLRTTNHADKVWKSLGDDRFYQNDLSFQFVEVLKGQEEVTAMAKMETDAGITLKLKMEELTDQIAANFIEDLPKGLASNYRQLAEYLHSNLQGPMPAIYIYPARLLPQGLTPTDMHDLLEAQKKITIWQSVVQTEIQHLKAQLFAEQAGRKWKDKYMKHMLQKHLTLKAKCPKTDISEQLGKLADIQYISRPVQTAWTDMWSLFNDTATLEQPEIPDHFASYWQELLQKSKWVEPLSEKTARQTITTIYAAKIKDDYASMRSNKAPHEMPEFLHLYFQGQFGRSQRGEEKLMEFMATVITNKNQPEVYKFGLIAGMIADADPALSAPVLLPQEERIPTAQVVMQLPTNVNLPRLPLGQLQLAHKASIPIEDLWRRDPLVSFPQVVSPRRRGSGFEYGIYPENLDAHQAREESIPSVTRENNAPGSSVFCSPRIFNPNISTPRTRGVGVVLAPLPETVIGSPRWRTKQVKAPFVKDTKLLGMTNEELAHPLAENLVKWKTLFGSPLFSLDELPHPLTEESTEIVFSNSGVQDMLNHLSSERFLDSAGNVDLGVPVTGKQLPQLHALVYQACEAIDVEVPFMYVRDSPYCRAYLWCPESKRPSVIFNSALFDILSPFELQVVMAQQLSAFKYPKYRLLAMAWTVLMLAPTLLEQNPGCGAPEIVPEFNVGKIRNTYKLREVEQKKEKTVNKGQWPICSTIVNNLDRWIRFLDLVGDRAAYFISRDVSTVVSANMKMAAGSHTLAGQLNVKALLEQGHLIDAAVHAKELHDAFRLGAGFGKHINLRSRSEPRTGNLPEGDPMAGHMERKLGHLGVELRSMDLLKASHSLVVLRARELQRWAHEVNSRQRKPSAT